MPLRRASPSRGQKPRTRKACRRTSLPPNLLSHKQRSRARVTSQGTPSKRASPNREPRPTIRTWCPSGRPSRRRRTRSLLVARCRQWTRSWRHGSHGRGRRRKGSSVLRRPHLLHRRRLCRQLSLRSAAPPRWRHRRLYRQPSLRSAARPRWWTRLRHRRRHRSRPSAAPPRWSSRLPLHRRLPCRRHFPQNAAPLRWRHRRLSRHRRRLCRHQPSRPSAARLLSLYLRHRLLRLRAEDLRHHRHLLLPQ